MKCQINKDKWINDQINFNNAIINLKSKIALDCYPVLESSIKHNIVQPLMNHIIETEPIKIAPLYMLMSNNDEQKAKYDILENQLWSWNELFLTNPSQYYPSLIRTRKRKLVIIPCNNDNKLYQLLIKCYGINNDTLTGFTESNPQWIEYHASNDNILSNSNYKHGYVAAPYVDNLSIKDLLPDFYDRFNLNVEIMKIKQNIQEN